jgi:bifunctional ADP-heptose synthase (sugar kinase/adenylyltransferase)
MLNKSFETLNILFDIAKERNMNIAFNPSSYQVKEGLSGLSNFLIRSDVLILNLEEAQTLTSREDASAMEIAPILSYRDDQIIIITDGSRGATCFTKGYFYHITPSPTVKVVETTGAGDSFASGFVAGLLRKYSIEDALKLGMVEAESTIAHKGSKTGLLTKEESFKSLGSFTGTITKKKLSKNISVRKADQNFLPREDRSSGKSEQLKQNNGYDMKAQLKYFERVLPEEKAFILHNGQKIFSLKD